MYKLFFIAKNNIKKQKGEMITFTVLTFFAALFIFISVSMLSGSGRIADRVYDKINGEDVEFCFNYSEAAKDAAKKILEDNENIGDFEYERSLMMYVDYQKKGDSEWVNYQFFAGCYEDERTIQKLSISADGLSDSDILLPYYLKGKYQKGDIFCLKVNEKIYEFCVAGFIEDTMYSNPLNISIYRIYISDKIYREFENCGAERVFDYCKYKAKLSDKAKQNKVESDIVESQLNESFRNWCADYEVEHPDFEVPDVLALNWYIMKDGAMLMPYIALAIVFLFAVIIIIVSLIIISFNVRNFIQRNMTNTGIMEASGYTVKEIRRSLMLQIIMVTVIGAVLGLITGTLLMKPVGNILGGIAGFAWNQAPQVSLMLLTAGGILAVFMLATLVIGRRYKKISALDALRGGMSAHNFKKNHFSFEKTNLPSSVILSLKETFGRLGNSIAIVLIAAVLAAVSMVGFGMYNEFGRSAEKMLNFTGMELGEVITDGTPEDIDKLRSVEGVEHVVAGYNMELSYTNGSKKEGIFTMAYWDISELQHANVIEGRLPVHDNEIAFAPNVMRLLGVSVGDSIEVSCGGRTERYLITGKYQLMQQAGKTATMTAEGFRRINKSDNIKLQINAYISDGLGFEEIEKRIHDKYPDMELVDGIKLGEQSMETITSSISMICILICVVTVLIVIFIETLLIKAKIVREWKNYGVSKALGFTTKNLMIQTAISNIPSLALGSLIGIVVSGFLGSFLTKTLLGMFGFEKVSLDIPLIYAFIVFAGMLVVAILSSMLVSRRIRKLNPVAMITEE